MAIRVLTVGTGAVGSIYSWRLAQTCHITAVCRSNYDAVRENGFEIESVKFGSGVFRPHQVVRTVQEAAAQGEFDYILVTLKALFELYDASEIIAPAVSPKTAIVLIQNGLGIEEPMVKRFPNNPLITVVAYIGTSQIAPGRIRMAAIESLSVGTYAGSKVNSEPARQKLAELLEKGDVSVNLVDDMERVRWEKLFWNGSFSAVCSLTRMNTTQVIENESALNTVKQLMREIMQAASVATGESYDIDGRIEALIEGTKVGTSNYKPSMQLDLERGQVMEVEVILGVPLRRAKALGQAVPTLQITYDLLNAINSQFINKQK